MRGIATMPGFVLAGLAGLTPLQGQAQERRRTLAGDGITCSWETYPAPRTTLDVANTFQLRNGALVFDRSFQTTGYRPEQVAAPGGFRFQDASLRRFHPTGNGAGSRPENLRHRLVFLAPEGTLLGRLSLRFLWNGNVVHTAAPRVQIDWSGAEHRAEGRLVLANSLPLALLEGARGRLEVQLLSTAQPQPLFHLTYRLNGFELSAWHHDAARHPDLDATGVRPGGLLPRRCGGLGSRPAPAGPATKE